MKTLGTTTTYHGTEHAYLRGHKVRIVAVLKNALRADYERFDTIFKTAWAKWFSAQP